MIAYILEKTIREWAYYHRCMERGDGGPWPMNISPRRDGHPVILLSRRCHRIFVMLTCTALGMTALLALLPAAGHDQIWFLLMAKRWLAGAQLYGPEIIDPNLPEVVWLSAVAVSLGHLLHIQATAAGKLLVVLTEIGAGWLSRTFLRRAWRREKRWEFWALAFGWAVLCGAVPARDFGQRDHILAFLLLPYLLAAAVPWRCQPMTLLRVAAGAMAGSGICLKPHLALVPIAVELGLFIWPLQRRESKTRFAQLLRPEPPAVVLTCVAFLGAVRHFAPLYFTQALPLAREVYWAIGRLSVVELAWQSFELSVLATLATALFARSKPKIAVVRILLTAGFAATIAYYVQSTGWYYQQLPAITFFGAALGLVLLDPVAEKKCSVSAWAVPSTAALCMLALVLTAHYMSCPFTQDRAFAIEQPDPQFFTRMARGTPVAILTTSVDEAMMPTERYGLTWAQRTNNLWLMPALLRDEQPWLGDRPRRIILRDRLSELDAFQHRWMVQDLSRWKPELVLVERCYAPEVKCQVLEDRHDNLLDWFMSDLGFRAVWRNYAPAGTRGRFDAYTLKH